MKNENIQPWELALFQPLPTGFDELSKKAKKLIAQERESQRLSNLKAMHADFVFHGWDAFEIMRCIKRQLNEVGGWDLKNLKQISISVNAR